MLSYQEWLKTRIVEDLGYSLIPPNIPKTQTGVIGNELRTDSGKTSREKNGESENRFNYIVQNFRNKITELPVPRPKTHISGLGDLGMEIIGKTTFGNMKECWNDWKKTTITTKQMGNDSSTNPSSI